MRQIVPAIALAAVVLHSPKSGGQLSFSNAGELADRCGLASPDCQPYLAGVVDAANAAEPGLVCLPPDEGIARAAAAVSVIVRAHAEYQAKPAAVAVATILHSVYPCK